MARPKKPVAKKATKKTASSTRGRKPKSQTGTASIKMLSANGKAAPSTKRPPNNPDVPQNTINDLNTLLNEIKTTLDDYSQHLRSLDRMRLNGVGIKKLGFIERAYELALENGEFLPHYLTIERFGEDIQYFMDFRSLVDLVTQIREKLWNITIQSADCPKAYGFWARSLRYAQTPRIKSHELMCGVLPKAKLQLSGYAG